MNFIERAAIDLLEVLAERGEDRILDAAEATWPAEMDDYIANVGTPRGLAHNERTFAAVMRALAPKLSDAADAADVRATRLESGDSGTPNNEDAS